MIPFVHIDPFFAKEQLVLFLREWYMRPDGMIPAYEFNFSDVNPPVHVSHFATQRPKISQSKLNLRSFSLLEGLVGASYAYSQFLFFYATDH